MTTARPPRYAWDWFSRQRLLWREARSRLAAGAEPTRQRYGLVSAKSDVVARLQDDYEQDATVRTVVHGVIADIAFLGATDRRFEDLQIRNAPRGLRWWWSAITGENVMAPDRPAPAALPEQLEFPDVMTGYGDPRP